MTCNLKKNIIYNIKYIFVYCYYRALYSYTRCKNITGELKKELGKENQILSDFINSAHRNFERKTNMMKILYNLNNKLKKQDIIVKNNNGDILPSKNKKKEIEKIEEKDELQFSIIKENSGGSSGSINEMMNIDKIDKNNNNMEISIVQLDKLEEKEKNILQLKNFIDSLESDIKYIENALHKYKNSSNDLIMESGLFGINSMVFINKKDEKEEQENNEGESSEKKVKYFNELKNEFISLKKKLIDLLGLYKTEKEFTEIKKNELEKLDNIKKEYNALKEKSKIYLSL